MSWLSAEVEHVDQSSNARFVAITNARSRLSVLVATLAASKTTCANKIEIEQRLAALELDLQLR